MELVQKQRDFFATQETKAISFRKKALKLLQKEIISREDAIAEAIYKDFKKPKFETFAAETQFVLAELKLTIRNVDYWSSPERKSAT